jgi:hypothetical protein
MVRRLVLALAVLIPWQASAGPCVPGTLQDYIDLGDPGCSLGALVAARFQLEAGQSFATPIDPHTVQMTPGGSPSAPRLVLSFDVAAAAGDLFESFFHFDASAPALTGGVIQIDTASASGDGVVTATQDICPDGLFLPGVPNGCPNPAASLVAFVTESNSGGDAAGISPAASLFDVFVDVTVDGGLAGSASLGAVSITLAPEPSAAQLLASALAPLALMRARRPS